MMRILVILVAFLYGFIVLAQPEPSNTIITLNSDWKFCPQEKFQEKINLQHLECNDIKLPGGWESVIPKYNGYGILYTEFYAPKSLSKIQLGFFSKRIRDADKVYINGQLIGETGDFPPRFEKAVFYSRLYSIPLEIINYESENTIALWIYNDARPGGVLYSQPVIGSYEKLISDYHHENYKNFALIIILLVFSITNAINYVFNLKSKESLYFCLFLLGWAGYLYTSSNLILQTNLPLNAVFRFNIILFYSIFTLFILFIYKFFQQPLPKVMRVIIAIAITCIPVSLLLPEPNHLYYPVELVEVLSVPTIFYAALLLYRVNKESLAYAQIMTVVLVMYILFGVIEILLDLFIGNEATTYSPIGPWVLLVLSLAISFIVGHKNMTYYQRATYDGLTGTLRFDQFIERLQRLISRGERDRKPIVVLMVDLDNFKNINDQFGHINGDKVLKLVSETMKAELRHFDLLARYGGDEFCIAVMMDNIHDIKKLVERVHGEIKSLKISLNGTEVPISVTIGATIHKPEESISSLQSIIERADNLLIRSKASSKGEILW